MTEETKTSAQVEQEALKELVAMIQAIQFPDPGQALMQCIIQSFVTQAHVMALEGLLAKTHMPEVIADVKTKAFIQAREKLMEMTRAAPKIQVASAINGRH